MSLGLGQAREVKKVMRDRLTGMGFVDNNNIEYQETYPLNVNCSF